MQRLIPSILALALLAALLGGCATAPLAPTVAQPVVIGADDYRPAWDAAVAALTEGGYVVDRDDYRFGRLDSRPVGAPTVFEPWKGQNLTLRQAGVATLNDARRRVRVALDPVVDTPEQADLAAALDAEQQPDAADDNAAKPGQYELTLEVLVERRQAPLRRLVGWRRRALFSDLDAVPVEMDRRGVVASYWQPVTRDVAMEQKLLAAILEKMDASPTGDESPAPAEQ